MTGENSNPGTTDGSPAAPEPRRNMMTSLLALTIGALVGIVPFVSGLLFFLGPVVRKTKDADGQFIPLGISPDALPADGTPQMVRVFADKVDAWNKFIDVPIGTVWLSRRGGEILCFNTICPHLGCSVDYRASENDYFCPCHTSAFDLDGTKTNMIPPRNMDGLQVRTKDGLLEVEYKNFRAATANKEEV
jgi:menaquinol-cytochrome c reductase iron-sulfur subunit